MTTPQAPISSGFSATSTADDVVAGHDLTGAVAFVTGGHAGLGLETTRALASVGATVVVGARDVAAATAALAGVPRVEVVALDLGDPASIDACAAQVLASGRSLSMLINNAGIMAPPLSRDARGFESQLATNHYGHFQLTARLWPALIAANGARVVSVSSRGHRYGGVDFEDPYYERHTYEKWAAYGQSKTANILFAVALDRRGHAHGVRAFSVHPGTIVTALMRSLPQDERTSILTSAARQNDKTTAQGAATSVWCATSPQLDGMGGVYCEDVDIAVAVADDGAIPYGVRPYATDPVLADRLWAMTEAALGFTFLP